MGHSLGGAIASLLAIMLRKKSSKELGFSPDIVTAIGYAPPPCVSRDLAECCSDYVSTVVMQVCWWFDHVSSGSSLEVQFGMFGCISPLIGSSFLFIYRMISFHG